ncbi:MAG: serine/threonine protein kinase [Deltaproteobacteria bacterium]|nr:serine/threonine protein kinase [Deltaproteobacteria bacterium]
MSGLAPGEGFTKVAGIEGVEAVPAGGETLGRYTLLYELAAGGMATLYLARVLGPGGFQKLVAIKRIHSHLARERSFVESFLDEARLAASIQHPNVAQIFELGQVNRQFFIVMEYVEGESLGSFAMAHLAALRKLQQPRQMPIRECTAVVAEAAAGLHAAHELCGADGQMLGVVHRDVSPQNILLTYSGHVKLVDFGVAKARGGIHVTTDNTLKGKLSYMSPEQVRAEDLDRRSDIFSLGIVLFEVTTGHRLFRHKVDVEVLAKILRGEVPPPTRLARDYPAALEKVVLRALAQDREQRYATAEEMRRALQKVLLDLGPPVEADEIAAMMRRTFPERIEFKKRLRESCMSGTAPSPDLADALTAGGITDVSSTTHTPRPGAGLPRRPLLLAAGGVLAIAAVAGIAAWFLRPPPPVAVAPPVATTSVVRLVSRPAGATILFDGQSLGPAPVSIGEVAVGPHTIAAELEGHERWERRIVVDRGGQVLVFEATLQPRQAETQEAEPIVVAPPPSKPHKPAAGVGKLTLKAVPWAEVWLDNKKLGDTPIIEAELPAGRHTLRLLPKGQQPGRKVKVTIKAGETVRREFDLR